MELEVQPLKSKQDRRIFSFNILQILVFFKTEGFSVKTQVTPTGTPTRLQLNAVNCNKLLTCQKQGQTPNIIQTVQLFKLDLVKNLHYTLRNLNIFLLL